MLLKMSDNPLDHMFLDGLRRFARTIGVPDHQAEDALRHAGHAKIVLSRRAFFGVVGASAAVVGLPASSAFAFPERLEAPMLSDEMYFSLHTADPGRFGAHEAAYGGYARLRAERTKEGVFENRCLAFPAAAFGFAAVGFLVIHVKEGPTVIDIRGRSGLLPVSAGIAPSVRLTWTVS